MKTTTNTTPKTYAEAIAQGYTVSREAWTRGYISRKTNLDEAPIQIARGGELYILAPSWQSTQYCIRRYLRKP